MPGTRKLAVKAGLAVIIGIFLMNIVADLIVKYI